MNENITTDQLQGSKKRSFSIRSIQARITNARSSYLALCFFVPVILTYLLYLAMEVHPFGNGSVLVLDLNAQYVYFFEALRDFAHGEADILYSFSRALGGEFVGIYAYYVASPLSYIVALFPEARMLEALLVLFLLKSGLCGLTFGFYLHKHSKNPNKVIVVAFSVMYALCAYAVVHQNNTMWIDALIWLPLLTYGIEQLIKFGKFKLFVIALAFTIWSNYYIGYMVCIYVALYFFYYFLAYGDGRNNPRGERAHFLRSFIRIAFFSLLAIAIVAFMVLGAYYSLSFGKNEFSSPNWSLKAKFELIDFFTKFLPSSYDTVRPEGLPFVYTGILTVILLPIFFITKKISAREKIAAAAFIGFFFLSFIASTLDLIWHGFQNPNWLNARYSFMLCFFLLTLAYRAFGNLRKVSEKVVLAICAFLLLLIAVAEKQELTTYVKSSSKLPTIECVWFSVILVVVFLALLCLFMRARSARHRENLSAIIAALICIEIFASSLSCMVTFGDDVVYTSYSNYNNYFKNMSEITETIQEKDKGFYRLERVPQRAVNDSFRLQTYGISGSTSTLNSDTIRFLNRMGYTSHSHWSQYLGGNPVSDSLLGIRYVVDNHSEKTHKLYYEEVASNTSYVAYKNDSALPLAFGVEDGVREFDMEAHDSHFERLNLLIASMLGEEDIDVFSSIPIDETTHNNAEFTTEAGHYKYTHDSSKKASVTMSITVPDDNDDVPEEKKEIFFYAPSDYTREAILSVNGSDKGEYFSSDTNRIISLGIFEEGQEVKVKLTLKHDQNELYLKKGHEYFYEIDPVVFDEAFSRLSSAPQYKIDEDFKDSHLTGSITTAKNAQMIQTTIPYDEGWQVYVDGKEVETYETLGALVAFDIADAGEHTLEMKYRPTIYKLGLIISLTGIAVFIAICVIELIFKKLFRRLFKLEEKEPVADELWLLEDFDETADEDEEYSRNKPKTTVKESFAILFKTLKGNKNAQSSKESSPEENITSETTKDQTINDEKDKDGNN